jgi:ribosomal protein S18 acetylase RimI-like enzyme
MPSAAENVPVIRIAEVADAFALGRLHVAAWRETYRGLVPDIMLAELSPQGRGAVWEEILRNPAGYRDSRVQLAERDGEMIGFAACCAQTDATTAGAGFDGEIGAIYLRRAAQRRGVGTLLMRTAAADLSKRGFQAASLWVLRGNLQARHFYEHLGGIAVGEKRDLRPEGELVELAYGWRDLRLLDREPANGPSARSSGSLGDDQS